LTELSEEFKRVQDESLGFSGLFTINGKQQVCLIDCGASKSFMSPDCAKELGLSVQTMKDPIKFELALNKAMAVVDTTKEPTLISSLVAEILCSR
jgi:predicted aspartyl protease